MERCQIRDFLAVAETLDVTRASERCVVSQPALTKAVQRLEATFGERPPSAAQQAVIDALVAHDSGPPASVA